MTVWRQDLRLPDCFSARARYLQGTGGKTADPDRALELYAAAAELGHPFAAPLGFLAAGGLGVGNEGGEGVGRGIRADSCGEMFVIIFVVAQA